MQNRTSVNVDLYIKQTNHGPLAAILVRFWEGVKLNVFVQPAASLESSFLISPNDLSLPKTTVVLSWWLWENHLNMYNRSQNACLLWKTDRMMCAHSRRTCCIYLGFIAVFLQEDMVSLSVGWVAFFIKNDAVGDDLTLFSSSLICTSAFGLVTQCTDSCFSMTGGHQYTKWNVVS